MGCAPSSDDRGRRNRRDTEYTDYGSDEELDPKTREHTRTSLGVHIVNKARYQGDDRYQPQNRQDGRFYNAVKRIQNKPKSPNKVKSDVNEYGMKRLPTRLEIMIEQMRGRRPKKRKVNLHTKTYLRVKEMDKQAKEDARMKQFSRQSRIIESRGGSTSLPTIHYESSPLPDIVEEEYWSHHGSVAGSPSPRGSPGQTDRQLHKSVTVYEYGGKVSRGTDYYHDTPPSPMVSPRNNPSRSIAIQTESFDTQNYELNSPKVLIQNQGSLSSDGINNAHIVDAKSPTQKREPWAQKRQPVTGKPESELEKERLKMEIFQTAAAGHLQRQRELKRVNGQATNTEDANNGMSINSENETSTRIVHAEQQTLSPRYSTPMVPYSKKSPRTGNVTPRGSNPPKVNSPGPPRGSKTYQELSHGAKSNTDHAFIDNVSVNAIPKSSLRTGSASTA